MKKLFLLLAIVTLLITNGTFAQKTWTGITSTAWNTATNWSPNGVPAAGDNVIIPSAPANQPLISGTVTPTCNNLTVNSGATLTISGTTTNNALLTANGSVIFNGALSMGGSVTKTGKLNAGSVVWNSTATISSYLNSRMEVNGNWEFASGSAINMGYCYVTFLGSTHSNIINKSSNSSFSSLTNGKNSGFNVYISATSTAPLNITGSLTLNAGTKLYGEANITTILGSGIINSGNFYFNAGTVSFEKASGTQLIQINPGDYFNALKINGGATVSIDNNVFINDDFILQSGTFDPANYTVNVSGDWINTPGPANFLEGTGKVVFNIIINKNGGRDYDQVIQSSENFNILEINNNYGDLIINSGLVVVTCNQYDWVAGGINVSQGSFTALDLVDDGLFGKYTVSGTGTINLTNSGGYVDLSGNLNISGGTMNVYGGITESYWPYNTNATITMSNGTLNFADQGIRVSATTLTLASNITGGTIKSAKNFSNYRSDFNPAGGTIEMCGPADANLYCVGTAALYSLKINKTAAKDGENSGIVYPRIDRETGEVLTDETRSQIVNLTSAVTLNGDFTLSAGTFKSNSNTIQAKRNWNNYAGTGSFNPGTGRVIFNGGNYHQYCYNETFNILEVAKTSGGSFRLSSGMVSCAQYDWTAGSIDVNTATFTANDLYENGLYGGFYVNPGGTINLYQDDFQYIDLDGSLTFTGGGTINVYGGNGNSQWAAGANALITMNGGTLDFKDHGITLTTLSPNTITENITGGTIRTAGDFFCNRSDFTPTGGMLELYGSNDVTLELYSGNLSGLKINKTLTDDTANVVTLGSNAVINGVLTIESGTLKATNKTLTTSDHINVNSGGTFWLENASQLKILGGKALTVNEGGTLKVLGLSGSKPVITQNGATSNHEIQINGTISAKYAIFEYNYGVNIWSSAIVDPLNPFDQCTFQNGTDRFLLFGNSQELEIKGANFPTVPVAENVWKNNNAGRITFRDAMGAFSGAGYENDPYNRIDWVITQPGLWTGKMSSNWHTPGNWDDGLVPTATTDVTIPVSAPNMPLVSDGVAYCENLLINGTLTVGARDASVGLNLTVNGTLAMNHAAGRLFIYGDVNWNSGSGAAFSANSHILAYGNWYFNGGSNATLDDGSVSFYGDDTKYVRIQSSNCAFHDLSSYKTGAALLGFSASSAEPLLINGTLTTTTGSKFVSYCSQDIVVKGNINSYGTLQCTDGAVKLDGSNQYITPNVNDYFNRLIFSQTGNVMIISDNTNSINVHNNLSIQSGTFIPGNSTINIGGDWSNSAGQAAFNETGSTVTFNGDGNVQRIYNDENFATLVLDKASSGSVLEIQANVDVHCNNYYWNAGSLSVINGSFTAVNLADAIGGDVSVGAGGTITMGNLSSAINLVGRLFINGGTFNIITGSDSQWPGNGNASITMSDGELNVYPYGIGIVNNPPYLFASDITGGVIRTEGNFHNERNDFNPTGGILELSGTEDAGVLMNDGTLYNFTVNKSSNKSVSLNSNVFVYNNLDVSSGTLNYENKILNVAGNVDVHGLGVLSLGPNSALYLYPGADFSISDGGIFRSTGTNAQPNLISTFGTGMYNLEVVSGGTISTNHTYFYFFTTINITSTGMIDPYNAFENCGFFSNQGAALTINNNQDIRIYGAIFPYQMTLNRNVSKTVNVGKITMIDASGDGAGAIFENDPYNRIDWRDSQPGLWTGAVSTDWNTEENWDDFLVPTYLTNVLIPDDAPNMPVVSEDAHCNVLTVMGELTILGNNLWVSTNAYIYGHLNNEAGLRIAGDLYWCEGSTATFGDDGAVNILGDWYFNPGASVNLTNGGVYFSGNSPSSIYVFSDGCAFDILQLMKNPGASVSFDASSDYPLNFNDDFLIMGGNEFSSYSPEDINVKGILVCNGQFQCEDGRVVLSGTDQVIAPNVNDYFNTLVFNQTGNVTINPVRTNILNIKQDIKIESGVFSPGSSIIKVGRDWYNNAGLSAFTEGTSRVIFNSTNASENQHIYGNEFFNILEINQVPGAMLILNSDIMVICQQYDWTTGGLEVFYGVFTANDLVDNRIAGNWILYESGVINLYNETAIDFGGNISIYGGIFNLYGGTGYYSNWPYDANASLNMSGGILDFQTQSILIEENPDYSFTSNITGGLIKTSGYFRADHPGFDPTGGTVELYGETDGYVSSENGGNFYNLRINKASLPRYVGLENAVIENSLTIDGGRGTVNTGYMLTCGESIDLNGSHLILYEGSTVKMGNSGAINVGQGAQLMNFGVPENKSLITGFNASSFYQISVADGGRISLDNAIIENLDETGLFVYTNAVVDVDKAFNNCIFRNGKSCNNALLTINTNQDLVAENVEFDHISKSRLYNVAKWVNSGSVTFINAMGDFAGTTYEDDPYNRIFWGDETETHNITIPAGWSGLSSYLMPSSPAMEDVFSPVSADFIIAQTMTGIYYPAENINTIGNWPVQAAFKIKMANETTLTLNGDFEVNQTFIMNAGWNLIPVISNNSWEVSLAAQQLQSGLVIVKEVAGSKIYWPEFGINTLGWLNPGKAYYVLLSSPGALTFPPNTEKAGVIQSDNKPNLESPWGKIQNSGGSHLIAVPAGLLAGFSEGDVLGIFTSEGNCAGFEVISDIRQNLVVTAYADDPTTLEKEGFANGEQFLMKISDPLSGKEYSIQAEFEDHMPQAGYFTDNGVSALKSLNIMGISDFGNYGTKISISPNPSTGIFNINTGNESQDFRWQLFNMQGSAVLAGNENGNFTIDLSSHPKGIYNFKITKGGLQEVKKLVLR